MHSTSMNGGHLFEEGQERGEGHRFLSIYLWASYGSTTESHLEDRKMNAGQVVIHGQYT